MSREYKRMESSEILFGGNFPEIGKLWEAGLSTHQR
jgi:hypothetical protein